MLTAHTSGVPLWAAWSDDPLLLAGAAVTAAVYWRGRSRTARRPARRGPRWSADLGLVVVAVALLSPLDTLSEELASAHMVQHVLLTLVAAPLLVLGRSLATMLRGLPRPVRRRTGPFLTSPSVVAARRLLRRPAVAWLLHAGALWAWHSAVLYEAAVRHPLVHGVEHVAFLATALLFWSVVKAAAHDGTALLLVFTMALQSVVLAALLTFAPRPWYGVYAETAPAWSLTPLADQQLAGVVMWVPAGLVYAVAGLALLSTWVRSGEARVATVGTRSG